jgi:hypothetical protein
MAADGRTRTCLVLVTVVGALGGVAVMTSVVAPDALRMPLAIGGAAACLAAFVALVVWLLRS